MKILVTGGAGFIGGNFVHYMVNKYPEDMIVNLDKLTYAGNLETCKPVEGKPNYKFVKGDIADREFILKKKKKEKFCFSAHPKTSFTEEFRYFFIKSILFPPIPSECKYQ